MAERRRLTMGIAAAATVPVLLLSAPTAAAEPPVIDVPVEVLPVITVPPGVDGAASGLATAVRDAILGFNAGNPGVVNGLFGLLGGVSCALAAGSSNPCTGG